METGNKKYTYNNIYKQTTWNYNVKKSILKIFSNFYINVIYSSEDQSALLHVL